ncbi:MAG: kinase-like domain-containing protein [Benjaminiella poitrasii]|nr:MAG: kinase-like domain-containing protein [Benjaminiella poitrasii]
MQKSNSEPNNNKRSLSVINESKRRQSTGALKRAQSSKNDTNNQRPSFNNKKAWRSPGSCCEIPDILGNAYLKPSLPTTNSFDLRPLDLSKQITKKPWYPPNPYYQIPPLPPLNRWLGNKFEANIRKLLPRIPVFTSNPHTRYGQFKEIGTGVNGAVIRADYLEKQQGQRCAIKRCCLDSVRECRTAILRELVIMASGHKNLIKLREITLWRNDIWISMDLMRCSVFTLLCQRPIPEPHAIFIASEVLKAIIYLHGKGYLHRDIKCENILLGQHGQVKLADFGLSAKISACQQYPERLGTSKWMAPEVIREESYNEKIDVWSLGVTIIEMMDRVPPHYMIKDDSELFSVIISEPSPTFMFSYPSMYMRGLVAWLLDIDPSNRPVATDILTEIDTHVQRHLLPCSTLAEFTSFLNQ